MLSRASAQAHSKILVDFDGQVGGLHIEQRRRTVRCEGVEGPDSGSLNSVCGKPESVAKPRVWLKGVREGGRPVARRARSVSSRGSDPEAGRVRQEQQHSPPSRASRCTCETTSLIIKEGAHSEKLIASYEGKALITGTMSFFPHSGNPPRFREIISPWRCL